jgi:hypothetical protein
VAVDVLTEQGDALATADEGDPAGAGLKTGGRLPVGGSGRALGATGSDAGGAGAVRDGAVVRSSAVVHVPKLTPVLILVYNYLSSSCRFLGPEVDSSLR